MGHIPRIFACMKSKNDAVPMSCVQVALVLADSTVSVHYIIDTRALSIYDCIMKHFSDDGVCLYISY